MRFRAPLARQVLPALLGAIVSCASLAQVPPGTGRDIGVPETPPEERRPSGLEIKPLAPPTPQLEGVGTLTVSRFRISGLTAFDPAELVVLVSKALESATENLGDSKKEFEHLKGKEMGEVALKASKYMGRLTRALEYAVPQEFRTQSGMQTTIDKLQGAEKELLRVRKGGALPPGETSENAYALKVMKDNGLENVTSVAELETCFRDLKMKAEVEVRANAVVADALLALKGGG